MGALGTVAKNGIGLAFLANAFTGTATIENFKELAEGVGIDAGFLENGAIKGLIDGKEGPLSLIIGSLITLPKGLKQFGVGAGFLWLGTQLYQAFKKGELTNTVNQAFSAAGLTDSLEVTAGQTQGADVKPPMTAEELAATITIDEVTLARAVQLADGLNRDMADPAELVTSGPGRHGIVDTGAGVAPAIDPDLHDPRLESE